MLVALCVAMGTSQVALALFMFQRYDQEATQKLNQRLAAHLVEQNLSSGERPETAQLEALFDRQMRANPAIEIYLLDRAGRVLACTAPLLRTLKRTAVDLAPIQEFLSGHARFPLLGDDPRHAARRGIFSVARVPAAGEAEAYLYVILGGTEHRSIWDMLKGSYVFRVALTLAGGALLFAGSTAWLMFRLMTRPLERLADDIEVFRASDFSSRPETERVLSVRRTDEIDRVRRVYREMAEQIAIYIDRLKVRDSRRRDLVANIVHDLKGPLTVIRGYLDTLLLREEKLTDAQRKTYLATASRSGERLGAMLDDLLQLSKLEANEVSPLKEALSVAELLHDVALRFRIDAQAHGVSISAAAAPGVPLVRADAGMIERVLENLVRNAIAHTPRGGSVRLRAEPHESRVRIEVADTGRGIAQADLARVFDRFYQASEGEADTALHLGLGLAIVRRILEEHGSEIRVDSRLGEGSRFWFFLNRAD